MLTDRLNWEIRDQYLSLLEDVLNETISSSEFFTRLSFKDEVVRDSVAFLEKKEILLSFHKKAIKLAELLDPIMDE